MYFKAARQCEDIASVLHRSERRVKWIKLFARANILNEMNFMNELCGNLPQFLCDYCLVSKKAHKFQEFTGEILKAKKINKICQIYVFQFDFLKVDI